MTAQPIIPQSVIDRARLVAKRDSKKVTVFSWGGLFVVYFSVGIKADMARQKGYVRAAEVDEQGNAHVLAPWTVAHVQTVKRHAPAPAPVAALSVATPARHQQCPDCWDTGYHKGWGARCRRGCKP